MTQTVRIVYTNWKGETSKRQIIPEKMWFGATEFHPEEQWLLHAFDVDKQAERDFAMKNIISWAASIPRGRDNLKQIL